VRRALLALVLVAALPPASASAAAPARTGNLLILIGPGGSRAKTARSAVDRLLALAGARPAGHSVPQIGLITVRPPAGLTLPVLANRLRALPGVTSVTAERRYIPRRLPNDPALTTADAASGVVQWALGRENFPAAWSLSHGTGALVGVIDSGIDATHPDLSTKIAAAVDQETPAGDPRTDQVGHGTHVSSLACAATNNGIGLAGAGYDCRLVVEKTDFTDSSIDAAIVDAADRHVQAINMSFGPADPTTSGPAPPGEVSALRYAAARGVVLVAAAADQPGTEQGDPANVLQPAGTGGQAGQGLGIDVTAAEFSGARAGFAGYGSEISMAAYGAFQPEASGVLGLGGQQAGIFGAFPGNPTDLESSLLSPCNCRTTFAGDSRYAYLAGTSMAAPQVAATAAMMRVLNPYATVPDVIGALETSSSRPRGTGWSQDLGWGILNAGAALDAVRRIDRLRPLARVRAPRRSSHRAFAVSWSGSDPHPGALVASGIAYYEVTVQPQHHRTRIIAHRTTARRLRFAGAPGATYTFGVIAVDRAGNREARAARATTTIARGAR
jgi:serine protease